MKIRLSLIIVATGLVLTSVSGAEGVKQPVNKLTIEKVEVRSKDILNELKIFQTREDIQAFTKAIDILTELESYERPDANEWPFVRRYQAELWVQTIQMIDVKSDRDFDLNNVPEINVAAPGPYPSGISPASIKESDLREQYEQAIAANKIKREKYEFQRKLKAMKNGILKKAEESLVALYTTGPENIGELRELLQSHGIDKQFAAKIGERLAPQEQ